MSQATDLAATTDPQEPAVAEPGADWGATAAEWRGLTLQEIGSTATVKTDWPQGMAWNYVRLEFNQVSGPQKAPGADTTYTGQINFTSKWVRVPPVDEGAASFYVSALSKVGTKKMACVHMAGEDCQASLPGNGPTPWVAEEWGPPGSGE